MLEFLKKLISRIGVLPPMGTPILMPLPLETTTVAPVEAKVEETPAPDVEEPPKKRSARNQQKPSARKAVRKTIKPWNSKKLEIRSSTITHTLTSAFCPAADDIVAGIFFAAVSVEGVANCYINTVYKLWEDRITASSKYEPYIYVGKIEPWRLVQGAIFPIWQLSVGEPWYTAWKLDH